LVADIVDASLRNGACSGAGITDPAYRSAIASAATKRLLVRDFFLTRIGFERVCEKMKTRSFRKKEGMERKWGTDNCRGLDD
jgi:hypothetical protein